MAKLTFGDRLAALCALELSDAGEDAERIGAMIERLVNAVSFTIAIAGRGEPQVIDNLIQGAEAYLLEGVSDHGRMGEFMRGSRR